MKNMCSTCSKRETCSELCEEAEKYANSDWVTQDQNVSYNSNLISNLSYPISNYWINKSVNERLLIYQMFFLDGNSKSYISKYVSMSKQGIGKLIKRLVNNIPKNPTKKSRILQLHFLDNYSITDIASELNTSYVYVSQVINDYLRENKIK